MFFTVLETASYISSVNGRSYGPAGDGQVHENPEWEKARQALASINKSAAKAAQDNRAAAEVRVVYNLSYSLIQLILRLLQYLHASYDYVIKHCCFSANFVKLIK